jgi:uncharacterized protein (DUF2141 family)
MKTTLAITLLVASFAAQAQPQAPAVSTVSTPVVSTVSAPNYTLTVDMEPFRTSTGTVFIALQDPNEKAVQRQAIPLTDKSAKAVFHNLLPGKYAIRFFHDENNNRQLDKGIFGIPKEEWGCSNNVKVSFGPPKFEAMLFTVDADKTIVLAVK